MKMVTHELRQFAQNRRQAQWASAFMSLLIQLRWSRSWSLRLGQRGCPADRGPARHRRAIVAGSRCPTA